jgi:hypothetical protein
MRKTFPDKVPLETVPKIQARQTLHLVRRLSAAGNFPPPKGAYQSWALRILLRLAKEGKIPLREMLELAIKHLNSKNLDVFVRRLGVWKKNNSGPKPLLSDDMERTARYWDGFDFDFFQIPAINRDGF